MHLLNQFSFVAAAAAVLGLLWFLLRRRGRWLRRTALLAAVAGLAVFAFGARTTSGVIDEPAQLDRALARGEPVLLEFFSNY